LDNYFFLTGAYAEATMAIAANTIAAIDRPIPPAGPVISGTVKVADSELVPSLTVTVWLPGSVCSGTETTALNSPAQSLPVVPAIGVPSQVMVISEFQRKPCPSMVKAPTP